MKEFVVHDYKKQGRKPFGGSFLLEYYAFYKNADGSYSFSFCVGWPEGGHYNGASNTFELPKEWLSLSWNGFLDEFTKKYKEDSFGMSKAELMNISGLREFFAFNAE